MARAGLHRQTGQQSAGRRAHLTPPTLQRVVCAAPNTGRIHREKDCVRKRHQTPRIRRRPHRPHHSCTTTHFAARCARPLGTHPPRESPHCRTLLSATVSNPLEQHAPALHSRDRQHLLVRRKNYLALLRIPAAHPRKKREELEKTVCKNVSYGEFNSESCVGRFPLTLPASTLLAVTRGRL